MHYPAIKLFDTEKQLLTVEAVKPDGTVDETVEIKWASSAPDQVAVDPVPGTNGRKCYALTPLDRGAATITFSARGFSPHTVEISYEPPVPGELNLSLGAPEPD